MGELVAKAVADELLDMAIRIDNDGTPSQIVSADELRELRYRILSALEAPPPSADMVLVPPSADSLRYAVLSCSHMITSEEIVLRRSDELPGNALRQLHERLAAALAAVPVLPSGDGWQDVLRNLTNTADGLSFREDAIRNIVGNTNWRILRDNIAAARAILPPATTDMEQASGGTKP